MNREQLQTKILKICIDDTIYDEDRVALILASVDKYVKHISQIEDDNNKIVINSLLYLGQSISEVYRLAFDISELLKVVVEFNFNGVEMTVDNKTSFEDFKKEFIERVSILHV